MRFAEICYDSPDYRLECELRQSVLRAPLGLNLYDEDLTAERHQQHFGLFQADGNLAACVIATAISANEVKIRQMAVRPDLQGQGLGKSLLTQLQQTLAAGGIRHLSLHARCNVAGFYQTLGFAQTGDEFTEVGIPHIKMVKFI